MEMKIQRRAMLALSAATLALPRLACAEDAAYPLGTLFPMSGPNAEFGAVFSRGVQFALDHIAADHMLSKPIALKVEDSLATPQGGAIGMNKLANVDDAPYVLVGFSGVSKAAAPIGNRRKVVMVNGGGVSPELATLSPYFWNVIPLVNFELKAMLAFLAERGLKKLALVYVDDPLGNGILKQLQSDLPGIGGSLAGSFSVAPDEQQFSAVAAKVRELKPDAVYFASYGAQQLQIVKQLRDNGITQQLVTYSAAALPSVSADANCEGLLFSSQASDWDSTEPVTKRFVTDWRAKYNTDPTVYTQNYYNAVRLFALLVQGLEKAKQPVNGETLLAEMLRVRRFNLVGGEGVFDDHGVLSMPIQVNQIKSGKAGKVG